MSLPSPQPRSVLLTSFEPYANRFTNVSMEVAHGVPRRYGDLDIDRIVLSCDSVKTPKALLKHTFYSTYGLLVMLGEHDFAGTRGRWEVTAYNQLRYECPDNFKRSPRGVIDSVGPHSIDSPLWPSPLSWSVFTEHFDVSVDPGRHLCNHSYYTVLHEGNIPAVLVHISVHASRIDIARTTDQLLLVLPTLASYAFQLPTKQA